MLQVEILSGGDVIQQLEVDGNTSFTDPMIESGKELPDFIKTTLAAMQGDTVEARVKAFIDSAGNQASLKKGNGARVYKKGQGDFVSHLPEKPDVALAKEAKEVKEPSVDDPEAKPDGKKVRQKPETNTEGATTEA